MNTRHFILASASPRRKELLAQVGIVPDKIVAANIHELAFFDELPEVCVRRLAVEKASVVALLEPNACILAADTIIVCEGMILGKPMSFEHAVEMWRKLSCAQHTVLTAVAVHSAQFMGSVLQESKVRFAEIPEACFLPYWQSGEPCDKAGAYAVQGMAAMWIESIQGSYSGVMGLPLFETMNLLRMSGMRMPL